MSRHITWLPLILLASTAGSAVAVEYPLQFAPSGNYKDLVVAGYAFAGTNTVSGNCSYTRITSGSGRDPRTTYTPVPQTCTWDYYGKLLTTVAGAPVVPFPVSTSGTETIYAQKNTKHYTGTDTSLSTGGFVFTYGSRYDWLTSNAYMVLPQAPYTFTAVLGSIGDAPLSITAVHATVKLTGAKVTIGANTCTGTIAPGATCAVTVTYDDTKLSSTTGLAYDTLTIHVASNAGQANDFVQSYTDQVKIPPD
jgi:hypothetical protein